MTMPSKSGGTHARRAAGAANSTAGMARQGSNNGAATAAAGLAGLGAASSGAVAGGGGGAINSNGTHAHEGIEGMDWATVPIPVLHRYRHAYRLRVPSASGWWNTLVLGNGIGKRTPSRAGYAMAGVAPPGSASSSLTTAAAMVPSRSSSGSSSSPGVITPGEAGMEVIPTRVAGVAGNGGVASGRRQHGTVLMKRTRMTREQLATVVRKNFNAQPINESDVIVNFLYSVKNQDKMFRLRFPPRS